MSSGFEKIGNLIKNKDILRRKCFLVKMIHTLEIALDVLSIFYFPTPLAIKA